MTKPVFFIDDDEYERRSTTDVLNEVFQGTSIHVEALPPLPTLADYGELIATQQASALILDERLNTAGGVAYTGVELAAHLRAIGGKLPIVILTNFPDDDFIQLGWAVEDIVAKKRVLNDPASPVAQALKARLSRQVEIAGGVLAEREKRYHELLVKFARTSLTAEEKVELEALEAERIAPVSAAERERQQQLDKEIENLKRLLG
jgi:DNA-binding NarL/FixJ family response regulator